MKKTKDKKSSNGCMTGCLLLISMFGVLYLLDCGVINISLCVVLEILVFTVYITFVVKIFRRNKKEPNEIQEETSIQNERNYDIPIYHNNKKYKGYTITETISVMTAPHAKLNAQAYLNQASESARIVETTTNPLTFFYRYDFMIKRNLDLIKMSSYV